MEKTFTEYEFRLNKKNAECFRTMNFADAQAKLAELSAKRPGIYSIQYRSRTYHTYSWKRGWDNWGFWNAIEHPEKLPANRFKVDYPYWY